MMNNVYDRLRSVPENAKKAIKGGAYGAAGLTDVNPQWRIQRMTEEFGPCGIGWTWEPVEVTEANGHYYAHVVVRYKYEGAWSEPVHGYGGTKLSGKDDSDVIKSTCTDAISNALRYLGVGADVWYASANDAGKNQFDTKYSTQQHAPEPDNRPAPPQMPNATPQMIAAGQLKYLQEHLTAEQIAAILDKYGIHSLAQLTYKSARAIIDQIKARNGGY